jgi:hypothetical protein
LSARTTRSFYQHRRRALQDQDIINAMNLDYRFNKKDSLNHFVRWVDDLHSRRGQINRGRTRNMKLATKHLTIEFSLAWRSTDLNSKGTSQSHPSNPLRCSFAMPSRRNMMPEGAMVDELAPGTTTKSPWATQYSGWRCISVTTPPRRVNDANGVVVSGRTQS